jgi:hypothetical protein
LVITEIARFRMGSIFLEAISIPIGGAKVGRDFSFEKN